MTDHDLDATAERLRRALHDHTAGVEPAPDSLRHIEEELMSDRRFDRRHVLALGGVAAAVALVIGLVVLSGGDDDPELEVTDTTTTTSAETSTTSTTATTTTTTFAPTTDPSVPIFPAVDSSRRFQDPQAAAAAFATEFIGFTDPMIGEFLEGDGESGEVEVRTREDGPVTIVLLRLLDDGTWGVIGAATEDISPTSPDVDDVIGSPVSLRGEALAFEGTVDVEIRAQGGTEALGHAVVTGSGTPPAGPYEGEIEFSEPSRGTGAVLYRVFSAEDGSVEYAAATRVQFAEPG